MIRRLLAAGTITFVGLTVAPAMADTVHFSCDIATLAQRTDGFKVTCANGYSFNHPRDGNVTIRTFVPADSDGLSSIVHLSEVRMAAFQAMAILAYEQEKPLVITFDPQRRFGRSSRGGYAYDCPYFSCRASSEWTVQR